MLFTQKKVKQAIDWKTLFHQASPYLIYRQLSIFTLNPNPIHFQHFPAVDLEPTVHKIAFLFESPCRKEFSELFLCEEIAPSSITSKVEIVAQAFSVFKAKLCEIIPTVIPEENLPTWL